jgi:2-octaprenyl-6-methoxyphenol hydroxylase
LKAFAHARADDTRMGVRFTDTLVGLFSTANPLLTAGRGLGLAALDVLPPLRKALARRMIYGA